MLDNSPMNLAPLGKAYQSGRFPFLSDPPASAANDRNIHPFYGCGSCIVIKPEVRLWWKVQLQSVSIITEVVVYSRVVRRGMYPVII